MKKTIFCWIAVFLTVNFCCAQAGAGFAPVDSWMDANASKIGGRAILVVYKDGRPVYSKAVNELSRKQKIVNKFVARKMHYENSTEDYTASSRQPIASCSKWLSAALIMSFVDDGSLKLTDTVGRWLPVLSTHGKGGITIGECMSHLTGIVEPPLKESLRAFNRLKTMDEAMELVGSMPTEGDHGTVFRYSNAGLQIAGAVIEKIGGKNFGDLFQERIARPLDMQHTDFGVGPVALPAGGAQSSPEDYINFLYMIEEHGMFKGHRILSEGSIAEMEMNRLDSGVRISYSPGGDGDHIGYGYGEWIMLDPSTHAPSGSITSPGLFGSIPWVDHARNYCAFLMTFYLDNKGRNERLIDLKKTVDAAIEGKE